MSGSSPLWSCWKVTRKVFPAGIRRSSTHPTGFSFKEEEALLLMVAFFPAF